MFQPDYVERLIAIGERDAFARADDLRRLVLGAAEVSQENAHDRERV